MVRNVCGGRRRHGEVCIWGQEKTWRGMYVGAGEDMVRYVCGGRRRHGDW